MTEENGKQATTAGRIAQIEDDVGSLKGEVGSLKAEFKILGNTVKGLGEDIAASDRKQEQHHSEAMRRQEQFQKEWRDQKDAERREHEQLARSRQIGPVQALQMAAAAAGFFAIMMGGFFFLVKAYIDGTITPVVTQLTERQNASAQSSIARNDIMDSVRSDQTKMTASLAETNRVAQDNRAMLADQEKRIRVIEIEAARREERQQANERIRDLQDNAERQMREMADTALRDELRSLKARMTPP